MGGQFAVAESRVQVKKERNLISKAWGLSMYTSGGLKIIYTPDKV